MSEYSFVVGLDECGRGSLSGPVAVGAVLVPINHQVTMTEYGAKDSKKLSEAKRKVFYNKVAQTELPFHFDYRVEYRSSTRIDEVGINAATDECVDQILSELDSMYGSQIKTVHFDRGLLPKRFALYYKRPETTLIEAPARGEDLYPAVAAASVIAKVQRDFYMGIVHKQYPLYDFESNKGYASAKHREALRVHGPIEGLHRRSFLRNIL